MQGLGLHRQPLGRAGQAPAGWPPQRAASATATPKRLPVPSASGNITFCCGLSRLASHRMAEKYLFSEVGVTPRQARRLTLSTRALNHVQNNRIDDALSTTSTAEDDSAIIKQQLASLVISRFLSHVCGHPLVRWIKSDTSCNKVITLH